MEPLMIEEEIDALDSGDESDHDLISTDMLKRICDGGQSHMNNNQRKSCYKIYLIVLGKKISECKGALKATRNMRKGLRKVFNTVVKEISQDLPPLGESDSEVSHVILEPRNSAEVKNCRMT